MTQKIYTTARGVPVDIGALRLQNENVRAVGNMGVNARGDRIDGNGNIIETAQAQLQRRLQQQSTNVSDAPVQSSRRPTATAATPAVDPIVEKEIDDSDFEDLIENNEVEAAATEETAQAPAGGGLAAAIARAQAVKQELDQTPKQKAQSHGVKRI